MGARARGLHRGHLPTCTLCGCPAFKQAMWSEHSRSSHLRRALPGLRRDLPNDLGQVHPKPAGLACGQCRPPPGLRVPLLVRVFPQPLRPPGLLSPKVPWKHSSGGEFRPGEHSKGPPRLHPQTSPRHGLYTIGFLVELVNEGASTELSLRSLPDPLGPHVTISGDLLSPPSSSGIARNISGHEERVQLMALTL